MNPGEEPYAFLGISVCKTVEERVQEKQAASKQKTRRVAKKFVGGVFRLPSCCMPQTLDFEGDHVSDLYAPSYGSHGEIEYVRPTPPAPKRLQRKVIIYSPNASTKQDFQTKEGQWRIGFEALNKWESPLLGWTSTGDSYSGQTGLYFESRGAAIEFAKKYGWLYKIKDAKYQTKGYTDDYNWEKPQQLGKV